MPGRSNGSAILSTGRTYLKADDYQVAKIYTHPENRKLRTLFWRRTGDAQNLQTLPIAAQETMVYLRNAPEWRGPISEMGLVFREDQDHQAGLSQLTLQTATTATLWSLVTHQWLQSERWSQRSANALRGGADDQLLPLPIVVGSWLLLTVLLQVMLNRKRSERVTSIAALALIAWLVLDVRWLANRWRQAIVTDDHYRQTDLPDALDMGEDETVVKMAHEVVKHLGTEPLKVAIGMASDGLRFEMRRVQSLCCLMLGMYTMET